MCMFAAYPTNAPPSEKCDTREYCRRLEQRDIRFCHRVRLSWSARHAGDRVVSQPPGARHSYRPPGRLLLTALPLVRSGLSRAISSSFCNNFEAADFQVRGVGARYGPTLARPYSGVASASDLRLLFSLFLGDTPGAGPGSAL